MLLRPGTFHDYGVEPVLQRWELLWTHFLPRAHWHQWLNWPEFAPGAMHVKIDDPAMRRRLVERLKTMHSHATAAHRSRGDFALNALEEVLLLADTLNPASSHSRLDARMQDVVDYICRNLSRKISLGTLAEVSGLSLSRMAHLFREQVGSTPQRFLEQQCLDRAMQLLAYTRIQSSRSRTNWASTAHFISPSGLNGTQVSARVNLDGNGRKLAGEGKGLQGLQ